MNTKPISVSKLPGVGSSLRQRTERERVELSSGSVMELVPDDRTEVSRVAEGIRAQVDDVLSAVEVVLAWVPEVRFADEPNRIL